MSKSRLRSLYYFVICLIFGADILFARIADRDEALHAAFPGAEIQYTPIFLTDQQIKEAAQVSGLAVSSALVAQYKALVNKNEVGRAYLDTHTVRTKKESLLIILDVEGKVKRVEIVAFLEPPEYVPPDRWYRQFEGKKLSEGLQLQRDIHLVTGASLTARATTDAVRRVLAIDQLLRKKESGQGK